MKFKPKRHIVIPSIIIIYTTIIALYAGVNHYTPDNRDAYILVIGVNLALAIALYFILKKRESFRNNNKK